LAVAMIKQRIIGGVLYAYKAHMFVVHNELKACERLLCMM